MGTEHTAPRVPAKWVVLAAALAVAALGSGALVSRSLARSSGSLRAVLAAGGWGGRATPRVRIGVGNVAGVGGDAMQGAAREAIESALSERPEVSTGGPQGAQRGARAVARGHYLDANVQSITAEGQSTRVQVSIVVSSMPARAYEFESSSSVTLTGAASSPELQASGVRRAMRAATTRALDQILQGAR